MLACARERCGGHCTLPRAEWRGHILTEHCLHAASPLRPRPIRSNECDWAREIEPCFWAFHTLHSSILGLAMPIYLVCNVQGDECDCHFSRKEREREKRVAVGSVRGSVGVSWSSGLRLLDWRCEGRGSEFQHSTNILLTYTFYSPPRCLNGYRGGSMRPSLLVKQFLSVK